MIKIALDTNSLVYIFDNKTDIESALDLSLGGPYKLFVPQCCINELIKLKRQDVVSLIKSLRFNVIESEPGDVDGELIRLAKEKNMHVMTEDRKLIAKARLAGVVIIRRSGKDHFSIIT